MIDFVLEHWASIIMGGAIVGLWIVARDRRKAVDRFNDVLRKRWGVDTTKACYAVIAEVLAAGQCANVTRKGLPKQDAPGRVIARSVRRMTKEKA